MAQKILIIQTAWLGDNILTTPLVANAAECGDVDVLTTPKCASIYENNPHVNSILTYDKHGCERGLIALRRKARYIQKRKYDSTLIAQYWWRSAALAAIAAIPQRIGFDISPAKRLYTMTVPHREDRHEYERLLELIRPLMGEPKRFMPQIYPLQCHIDTARGMLELSGWHGENIVVLAPASAWRTKRYPHFRKLAEMLLKSGIFVISMGAKDDMEICRSIIPPDSPSRFAIVVGQKLLVVAALLKMTNAVIANDSGAGHLASAMETPVVSIFGPTVPKQGFAPLGERNKIIQMDFECRPCSAHGGYKCPLGNHKCMTEIKPKSVVEAVLGIINK